MTANPHLGSSLDDFLDEEGIGAEVRAHAVKRVLAWQIEVAMKEQGLTKAAMARRLRASRAQLDLLLDPVNDKVELDTLQRVVAAVGRTLRLEPV